MDNVVVNITDTPNEVTVNITEAPINVTINVTEGAGGGMQCADLEDCQTIIDIQQAIQDAQNDLSTHESDTGNPHDTNLQQAINANNVVEFEVLKSPLGTTKLFASDSAINIQYNNGTTNGVVNAYSGGVTLSAGDGVDSSSVEVSPTEVHFHTLSVQKEGKELATEEFVDNRVQSNIKIIGDWDASSGSMPLDDESNTTPFITQWGSTIKHGWAFRVGYAQNGNVHGYEYENGDVVYALIDNPTDNPTDWGDLDHNLQQADESLRGTAKIADTTEVSNEVSTDDEKIITPSKIWGSFWARVLALAWTWQLKQTFTAAPRFNSATNNSYLKTSPFKDLTSVSVIPATDITEDSTHRFATDAEKLIWNRTPVYSFVTGSNFTTGSLTLVDITGLSNALDANSVYEVVIKMTVESSSNNGLNTGVNFSAAGATIEAGEIGARDVEVGKACRLNTFNTAHAVSAWVRLSGTPQTHEIKGIVRTGANAGNLTAKILKVSSGTATVYINSYMKTTKIS